MAAGRKNREALRAEVEDGIERLAVRRARVSMRGVPVSVAFLDAWDAANNLSTLFKGPVRARFLVNVMTRAWAPRKDPTAFREDGGLLAFGIGVWAMPGLGLEEIVVEVRRA